MAKKKTAAKKRKPSKRRDPNLAAFDMVQHIIKQTEKSPKR
jgi:hypothetical protein